MKYGILKVKPACEIALANRSIPKQKATSYSVNVAPSYFFSQTKKCLMTCRQQNRGADSNKYKNRVSKVLKQIHPEVHHFEKDSSRMFSGFCPSVNQICTLLGFYVMENGSLLPTFLDQKDVLKHQQQTKTICCKNPRQLQVATPPGPTSTVLVCLIGHTSYLRCSNLKTDHSHFHIIANSAFTNHSIVTLHK